MSIDVQGHILLPDTSDHLQSTKADARRLNRQCQLFCIEFNLLEQCANTRLKATSPPAVSP